MKINSPTKNQPVNQSGQTLIETVIAIFILVSGIAAAVGLAIFAFSSSQNIVKQTVAVGLAREGIEAIKNMRNTNWLSQTAIDTNCYNPKTLLEDAKCYKNWITQTYCLEPNNNNGNACNGGSQTRNYNLGFDPALPEYWVLEKQKVGPNDTYEYGLDLDTAITGANFKGFYSVSHSEFGNSGFHRKIVITVTDGAIQYGTGPNSPFYEKSTGPKLLIQSQVRWTDKKCPDTKDWPEGVGECSVQLSTYLTNWKNY